MTPVLQPDLIFDLGLHKGEDTSYYLAKGFRVVAVEANKDLATFCRLRFQDEISSQRLTIVEGAIAPASAGDAVAFYLNPMKTVWGTIYPDIARKKAGAQQTGIVAQTVRRIDLGELFRKHGIPHYLKVDIEGADILTIEALRGLDRLPQFVSMEKLGECLEPLADLGYKHFRIVPQGESYGKRMAIRTRSGALVDYDFEDEGSGPYGEDLDLPWVSLEESKTQAARIKRLKDVWRSNASNGARFPGWYDTHAAL